MAEIYLKKNEVENEEGGIYSNYNHVLNKELVGILKNNPNKKYSQHSAWNFCGYVWYDGTKWKEEVWVYNSLQEILEANEIEDLIEEANEKYGGE